MPRHVTKIRLRREETRCCIPNMVRPFFRLVPRALYTVLFNTPAPAIYCYLVSFIQHPSTTLLSGPCDINSWWFSGITKYIIWNESSEIAYYNALLDNLSFTICVHPWCVANITSPISVMLCLMSYDAKPASNQHWFNTLCLQRALPLE